MAWFSKKKKKPAQPEPDASGPRDALLPALSVEQAAAATRLVHERLAVRGREGTVADGALTLDDGNILGLHNLSVLLAQVPYAEWQGAVDHQLDTLLTSFGSDEELADPSTVFVKLRRREDLPMPVPYAREVLPGVLAMLAVDKPDVVVELLGNHLAPVGGDADAAYRLATENLADLPLPEHVDVETIEGDPSSVVSFLVSDDFFGASRVLVLPRIIERVLGRTMPDHGVLVAVPNRSLIIVHLPSGPSVVAALRTMVNAAVQECETQAGPVSPEVYFVLPDLSATQVTAQEDDGSIAVHVDGPLLDAFRSLGLAED